MADVLQDAATTEFIRERWRIATSYEQEQILKSLTEFLEEQGIDIWEDDDVDVFEDETSDLLSDIAELEQEVESLKKQIADLTTHA